MTAPVLEILDVHMHFPIHNAWGRRTGWLRAVDGVSLTVARGEILGVVGESGCGKTTLGKTIVGIHGASAGEIRFEGHEVGSLSPSAGRAMRRTLQVPATKTLAHHSIRTGRSAARWKSRW